MWCKRGLSGPTWGRGYVVGRAHYGCIQWESWIPLPQCDPSTAVRIHPKSYQQPNTKEPTRPQTPVIAPQLHITLPMFFDKSFTLAQLSLSNLPTQRTRGVDAMLVECWATVCDGGPAFNKHWLNVLYLRRISRLGRPNAREGANQYFENNSGPRQYGRLKMAHCSTVISGRSAGNRGAASRPSP